MNIKKNWNNMSKNNKRIVLSLFLGIILMTSTVIGMWVLSYSSSPTGMVVVSSGVSYSDSFGISVADTTNNSVSKVDFLNITNGDGSYNVTVTFDINNTDTDLGDGCSIENDAQVEVGFGGLVIADGDVVEIPSGFSVLNVTTNLVGRSCPQEIATNVSLIYT